MAPARRGLMAPVGIIRYTHNLHFCSRPWSSFIFVSKYHNAPRSIFDAIHAKEYAAEDTARKIGKRRESYRSSSSDISLRLPEILLFSFFLLDVDIKVVAKPATLQLRNRFCYSVMATVIPSGMKY